MAAFLRLADGGFRFGDVWVADIGVFSGCCPGWLVLGGVGCLVRVVGVWGRVPPLFLEVGGVFLWVVFERFVCELLFLDARLVGGVAGWGGCFVLCSQVQGV